MRRQAVAGLIAALALAACGGSAEALTPTQVADLLKGSPVGCQNSEVRTESISGTEAGPMVTVVECDTAGDGWLVATVADPSVSSSELLTGICLGYEADGASEDFDLIWGSNWVAYIDGGLATATDVTSALGGGESESISSRCASLN